MGKVEVRKVFLKLTNNLKNYEHNQFNKFGWDFVSPHCTEHPQDSTKSDRLGHISEREGITRSGPHCHNTEGFSAAGFGRMASDTGSSLLGLR